MDVRRRIEAAFDESLEATQRSRAALPPAVERAAELLARALAAGGKVMACGNGGSASDAQHLAAELLNRFERDRPELAALALGVDAATSTAIGNDLAFEEVFARPLRALARPGDVLVVLTTSGASRNVVRAARVAGELGVPVVALTGRDGGALAAELGPDDVEIRVPAKTTPRIQEVHGIVIHCLCDVVDARLFPEAPR